MIFGSWNESSMYRTGPLMAVARELVSYKLYLVGIQKVSWDIATAECCTFFYGK